MRQRSLAQTQSPAQNGG
uniref:Uncharacterized protein n=1 Tax=Arundo donax TaxID=35708 RepID=A0A0A8ZE06_ARUDO